MTTRLLNSAMMPVFGTYQYEPLTPDEFSTAVRAAHNSDNLMSYIGYQQTAEMIASMAQVPIWVNRDQTTLEDGDVLLIARLAYRLANPATKGQPVVTDFIFGRAIYTAPK